MSKSFSQTFPITETHYEKARFWHPTKNYSKASSVTFGSSQMVHWQCPDFPEHEWQQRVIDFLKRDKDCPYCHRRKPIKNNLQLETKFPSIAREWNTEKNFLLTPDKVIWNSPKLVYWCCSKNRKHIWRSAISGRTQKHEGCPFCLAKHVKPAESLAKFKQLAMEWSINNPSPLSPKNVKADSSLVVKWVCENSHEFYARIDHRVFLYEDCPTCQWPERTTKFLSEKCPKIAKQWHPTLNRKASPQTVLAGSSRLVYWQCKRKHIWRTSVGARTGKFDIGCPYCAGKYPDDIHNLSVESPELIAEWDQELNKDIGPEDLTPVSSEVVWWKCSENPSHKWQASVANRTSSVSGCPFCSGRNPTDENRLSKHNPKLVSEWHDTKNGIRIPEEFSVGSGFDAWWKCSVNESHEWQAKIRDRVIKNSGCPFCAGKRASTEYNFAKSHPKLARQWHPTLNKELKPRDVTPGSANKIWWKCRVAKDHVWQSTINDRTSRETDCPFCSRRRVSSTFSLAVAFPEISSQWHSTKNGRKNPEKIHPRSNETAWWQCGKSKDHVWQTRIKSRTQNESKCPFCMGQKTDRENNLLARFPKIALEWHKKKNGTLSPSDVTARSGQKVYWQCSVNKSHVWKTSIAARTVSNTGCPQCSGRTASKDYNLKVLYPAIAKQWHPTKNGKLTARDVRPRSNKKIWWQCQKNPRHCWQSSVDARTRTANKSCPMCN